MNKKRERELNGPSWTEVILGAVLSLVLGVVLAAAYLVLKPATPVRELPKEPAKGVVYYLEGSRDSGKARQASAKQKTFLEGGSVVLTEDELNQLAGPAPAAPKEGAAEAAAAQAVTPGVPNFRIREGVLQLGVPVRVSVYGFEQRVIVQARGGFVKRGDRFVFEPSELYVGSCPVHRLPVVEGLVVNRAFGALAESEELVAAWSRLSDVAVDGSTLRLTL